MGVHEGRGQLAKGMKELMSKWLEAKGSWDDANAHKFETEFLNLLEKDLRAATAAMDHMGALLHQIKHECE